MIQIRHTGIYVNDIKKLENFYKKVFSMHVICSCRKEKNELLEQLLGHDISILTTKLITEFGKEKKSGDMLELVEIEKKDHVVAKKVIDISETGTMHIAFGVDSIEKTVDKVLQEGGKKQTDFFVMDSGSKCCFCTDPEGNWIELIQREAAT